MRPFLKWPGGKRWLIKNHSDLLPKSIKGKYFEPFLGSGAVYFYLMPRSSVISDLNGSLINTFNSIKLHHEAVKLTLQSHHENHSKEYYYKTRSTKFLEPVQEAAQFIYLNRTCFNGIFRVNADGQFNVPMGSKTDVLLPTDDFEGWSNSLQGAEIVQNDFEETIDRTEKGDFLFVDPPYTVRHNINGFVKYNEVLFSWEDQERLAESIERAGKRGVQVLVTNANHPSVKKLYSKRFKKLVVSRYSSISASKNGRNTFEELIITS